MDIWDDPHAAEFVRGVARGNDTVPTVRIGEIALVNPSARDVLRLVAQQAPEQLPHGYVSREPGRVERAITRLLGG